MRLHWKSLILILVIGYPNYQYGQTEIDSSKDAAQFQLKWKLDKADTIFYETVMSEIGDSEFEIDLDFFGDLAIGEESEDKSERFNNKALFKKLKEVYTSTDFVTTLTNSDHFSEVIEIEVIATPKEEKTEEGNGVDQMMNAMMKGTMLRGSIYKTGELHSFWVKSNQKNLISLFFELPNRPIKKGDSWTLDNVNFIANDHNFICEVAEKTQKIEVVEIKEVRNEKIVVIQYDLAEYVSGNLTTPSFFGSSETTKKETKMKFIYKAEAEFSIDKGRWLSYNGFLYFDAVGALNATQKQKFALIEKE